MQTLLSHHWHHLPTEEILELLEVDPEKGLDVFEIKHRQQRFGMNALTPRKGKSPLVRFLLQFNNPLIIVLLVTSVITLVVKDWVDAVIIFGAVLVNVVIGYLQEAKAEQAIQALARTMSAEATVLRAGKMSRLSALELVPGDVVTLQAGDKVPADIRMVYVKDLQVAEAALTGESVPVQKDAGARLPVETSLGDRSNMAFASTLVTYGQGKGVVVSTGDGTEIGRISQLIASAEDLQTPLTRRIAGFSRLLMIVVLALAAVTFVIGALQGNSIIDAFIASIALAVAAIPEGLPAAVTVTLAIGVTRMARRRAIIRKLPAVETLGSTTVICSDKTGTLTQNQMTVQKIYAGGALYQLTGSGYDPKGTITQGEQVLSTPLSPALSELLLAGVLCNDSHLDQKENQWAITGDPTEGALLVSARKAGLSENLIQLQLPRLDAIPFDSQHQYMATLHDQGKGLARAAYLKGAVEVLLEHCRNEVAADGSLAPLDKQAVLHLVDELAAEGLRVLAFARQDVPADISHITHADLKKGLTLLGLQAMIDPPRTEVIDSIRACQQAGIQVKMITGDHPRTAAAIARQIGLCCLEDQETGKSLVMTGKELAQLSDEQLVEVAGKVSAFARVSPEQKLRLVEALQARGNVVAMTGDGVNDAPALKQSNIGVAMGITGTDVAKEAADMVLTDDNFATIEAAVEEGRGVFDNLTKIITWTLPTNLGEGLVILAALVAGVALPILPVQILWINLVTVAVLGLVLALEGKEKDIMQRPPRDPQAPLLSRALILRMVIVSVLILAGAFGLFEWEQASRSVSLDYARTVAVNVVVFVELFYLYSARSATRSPFQLGFFSNRWVILGTVGIVALQLLQTYAPFMNEVFKTAPISLEAWGRIFLFSVISFAVIEGEKWLRRRAKPGA